MSEAQKFKAEVEKNILSASGDDDLKALTNDWLEASSNHKYTYNFSWLGRPIIQFPQDMYAMQELIWHIKPDLIIETGIAHGGSLILSASLLAMLDYADAVQAGHALDVQNPARRVLGIDIDIRPHNKREIEAHPMSNRIDMIQGSSIAPDIIAKVQEVAGCYKRVLVFLDSNHTHDHVLAELQAYAALASVGSYCVVFDTAIEDVSNELFSDRPWGKGNNPKSAVWQYLKNNTMFEIDKKIENKLLITVAPDGFLRRVS